MTSRAGRLATLSFGWGLCVFRPLTTSLRSKLLLLLLVFFPLLARPLAAAGHGDARSPSLPARPLAHTPHAPGQCWPLAPLFFPRRIRVTFPGFGKNHLTSDSVASSQPFFRCKSASVEFLVRAWQSWCTELLYFVTLERIRVTQDCKVFGFWAFVGGV